MADFIKTHREGKAMLYEGYNIIRFIKGKEVKFLKRFIEKNKF